MWRWIWVVWLVSGSGPTTGSFGTQVTLRLVCEPDLTSTPQRVHLEHGGPRAELLSRVASTPQRVHLERSGEATETVSGGSLQPHNGFIWNLAATSACRHLDRASTPQRVHLEPVYHASIGVLRPLLQPHNGFIWNEFLVVRDDVLDGASTPQRVHLEQYVCPEDDDRRLLQPHNGFIWNHDQARRQLDLQLRFNPTTGSSGTSDPALVLGRSVPLQPHNGFIWNCRLRGHVRFRG